MEYCSGGSILGIMQLMDRTLNEEEISGIIYQTLLGIEYLHSNKKIHRDIKAGNILLDGKGQVKLADFGVAAQLTYSCADKVHVYPPQGTFIGTPFWMSPEVISKSRYNQLTDIWSLGITAVELAEGAPPYSHIHPVRAMFVIKNNPPNGLTNPDQWSKEFNQFITACLKVSVNERPSAAQLLQYPFVKQGKQKKLINLLEYQSKVSQQPLTNCEEIENEQYNTLVVKDCMIQPRDEPDFLKWNKSEQQELSIEEIKKLKQQIEQQRDEEIEQVRQKYAVKLEALNQRIKQQPLNLPFSFQVSQEVLQQLANIKTPQIKQQKPKQKPPFEFIPKQKI